MLYSIIEANYVYDLNCVYEYAQTFEYRAVGVSPKKTNLESDFEIFVEKKTKKKQRKEQSKKGATLKTNKIYIL